jgi:hypothetical protein
VSILLRKPLTERAQERSLRINCCGAARTSQDWLLLPITIIRRRSKKPLDFGIFCTYWRIINNEEQIRIN